MRSAKATFLAFAIGAATLALDSFTPLGYGEWLIYLLPLLLLGDKLSRRQVLALSSFYTATIIAGMILSPPGIPLYLGMLNRLGIVLILWTETCLVIRRNQAAAHLEQARRELINLQQALQERAEELERQNAELNIEIEERLRTEEQLRRSEQERDLYVHTISHDLRTPPGSHSRLPGALPPGCRGRNAADAAPGGAAERDADGCNDPGPGGGGTPGRRGSEAGR